MATKDEQVCIADEVYLRPEIEKDLKDRLSRIEGHVRGIRRMLDEHKSCDEILIQMSAIKAALNQVTIRLLEGHMETCVLEGVKSGEGEVALASLKGALARVLKQVG